MVGFGLASFVEFTATGAEGYGRAGVLVSSQGHRDRGDGSHRHGHSTELCRRNRAGNSARSGPDHRRRGRPSDRFDQGKFGGHSGVAAWRRSWSSRGAAITGEVAWQAGRKLRAELLSAAAAILQTEAEQLDLVEGDVIEKPSGRARMTVAELSEMIQFGLTTCQKAYGPN